MRKSRLLAVPAALAAIALSAGPALAHECYIVNRSDQGNMMAGSKSQAWYTVDLNDELAMMVQNEEITAEQATCIAGTLTGNGVPLMFTIMVKGARGTDGLLIGNNPNEWLVSDGQGVDHFFDKYGYDFFMAFEGCGAVLPE
jgi:hypothetical protein